MIKHLRNTHVLLLQSLLYFWVDYENIKLMNFIFFRTRFAYLCTKNAHVFCEIKLVSLVYSNLREPHAKGIIKISFRVKT